MNRSLIRPLLVTVLLSPVVSHAEDTLSHYAKNIAVYTAATPVLLEIYNFFYGAHTEKRFNRDELTHGEHVLQNAYYYLIDEVIGYYGRDLVLSYDEFGNGLTVKSEIPARGAIGKFSRKYGKPGFWTLGFLTLSIENLAKAKDNITTWGAFFIDPLGTINKLREAAKSKAK